MERRHAAAKIAVRDAFETGGPDHAGQRFLVGEAADAFGEVDIGIAVPRHGGAQRRQHGEGVAVVQRSQPWRGDPAEFEAEEPAAGLQHAPRLRQRGRDPGDVPQPEGNRVRIDRRVRKGQRLGVAHDPVDAVETAAVQRPVPPPGDHGLGQVAHGDPAAAGVQEPRRDIAGAAGHVEEMHAGPGPEPVDQRRFPEAMHAERHQVVHDVVACRHAVEHAAHQRRLIVGVDVAEPEMGPRRAGLVGFAA